MIVLLDTDIVIDVRRQYPPALAWLASSRGQAAALSGLGVLELLNGARTKRIAREIELFTNAFRIYWPTVHDSERARHTFADTMLSHGTGILDMLVAQTAIGLGATLLTFNEKHFRAIPDLAVELPYHRNHGAS